MALVASEAFSKEFVGSFRESNGGMSLIESCWRSQSEGFLGRREDPVTDEEELLRLL